MSFSLQSRADRFHKDVRFSSSEQTPRPPTSASCKRDRPRAQLPRPARAVHAFCFAWVWVRSGQSQSACVNSARRLEPSRSHDRRIRAGEFQATVNARSGAKRPYSAWRRCAFQCRGRLRELDVGLRGAAGDACQHRVGLVRHERGGRGDPHCDHDRTSAKNFVLCLALGQTQICGAESAPGTKATPVTKRSASLT
jgi:hypothetical protein